MTEPRMVMCKKLGKELPGLTRQPYKNELGKRIYDEISQEAWNMWLKDSIKIINTYPSFDLATPAGQKFMFEQAEVYFGFKAGDLARTAFVPAEGK